MGGHQKRKRRPNGCVEPATELVRVDHCVMPATELVCVDHIIIIKMQSILLGPDRFVHRIAPLPELYQRSDIGAVRHKQIQFLHIDNFPIGIDAAG